MVKKTAFSLLTGRLGQIVGRKNLVRAGAFLARAGRQDIPNDISDNGESNVQKVVLENMGSDAPIVLDCGANIGQWSTSLIDVYDRVSNATTLKLYCFEPSSYTYTKLTQTLQGRQCDEIEICFTNKALSNKSGFFDLKIVHEGAGTNSLVAIPGTYSSVEQVEVVTLDEFAENKNLAQIDFLKIDAEGNDFDVIRGGDRLLCRKAIGVIQFEYNWRWIHARHFLLDVFEYFENKDYSIGKLTPEGIQFYEQYDVGLETFVEGNYLACTQEWREKFVAVNSWLEQ